jgi:RNA polymerase sigma-70 factor (ECF subfamily)
MSLPAPDYAALDEAALAGRVRERDRAAFRELMARCNQRLFRVARGLVASDDEAEDVVQEAYVAAFAKLDRFRGESSLATWLTRIVINEARQRRRDRKPQVALDQLDRPGAAVVAFPGASDDPLAGAARAELRALLEREIGRLPAAFRVVYVMRELEELDVDETAAALGIRAETVKTRLHRARRLLKAALERRVDASLKDAFAFRGVRCARITERVLARL